MQNLANNADLATVACSFDVLAAAIDADPRTGPDSIEHLITSLGVDADAQTVAGVAEGLRLRGWKKERRRVRGDLVRLWRRPRSAPEVDVEQVLLQVKQLSTGLRDQAEELSTAESVRLAIRLWVHATQHSSPD